MRCQLLWEERGQVQAPGATLAHSHTSPVWETPSWSSAKVRTGYPSWHISLLLPGPSSLTGPGPVTRGASRALSSSVAQVGHSMSVWGEVVSDNSRARPPTHPKECQSLEPSGATF